MRKLTSLLMLMLFASSTIFAQQAVDGIAKAMPEKKMVEKSVVYIDDEDPNHVTIHSEDAGDILWDIDIEALTGDTQNLGVEFDGTHMWVTGGNSGSDPNKLYKIDPFANTLVATYDQPSSASGWGIRDLCWVEADGLIYGGAGSFYSFDPATESWTTYFSSTFGTIRALAFDGDHFWTKSFSDPLYEFDIDGNIINQYPAGDAASCYGAAYDWNEGYLYLYCQLDAMLFQYDLEGNYTGVSYDISGYQAGGIAGGAFFDFGDLVSGMATIGALFQGTPDAVAAMELYPSTVYPNDLGVQSILEPNTGNNLGMEDVTVKIKNFGENAQSNFEVGYMVNGGAWVYETVGSTLDPGATMDYTFNQQADLTDYGDYDFEACTFLGNDENPDNDCATKTVTNIDPTQQCTWTIEMYDDFGDGWNGGTVDILADNSVIATFDGPPGAGPVTEEFTVYSGQFITTVFNCGSWCYECSYYIYDHEGNLLFEDGVGGVDPTGGDVGEANCQTFTTDVATISIDMGANIQPGEVIPKATVKNKGTDTQTFDVTMTINGYTSTKTVTDLAYQETFQVEFDPWDATIGTYTAEACTELAGDEDPSNDCMDKAISVAEMQMVYAYNAYDPSGTLQEGPLWFDLFAPGYLELLAPTTSGDFIAGACWYNDTETWYGTEYGTGNIYTIDHTNGDMTQISSTGIGMNGFCYDDATSTYYGVGDGNFYSIDPETGDATLIGAHNAGMTIISLAADGMGGLYGHSVSFGTNDNLYSFDPSTGQSTMIGSMGVSLLYAQDASFDKETGELYIAAYLENGPSGLYLCDVSTAELTLVGDFQGGAEIDGFAIPGGGVVYDHNLGVQNIISPESGYNLGMEDVTIMIKNYGTQAESNFDVYYTVDGGGMVTETITETLDPDMTYEYTFGTQADLSAYGVYEIIACTDLEGDEFPANDCSTKMVENVEPVGFPFEEGFDSGGFDENEWVFVPEQGNWQIEDGDGNPPPSAEFYWSPSTTNYEFSLTSPEMLVPGDAENAVLKFDLMLSDYGGTGQEHMTVEFWDGSNWNELFDFKNDDDLPWDNYQMDVSDMALGNMVKFRFRAWGADTWDINWWRIDNIKLYEQVQVDFFGYVTELASGDPIQDAGITVGGFSTVYTDATGYYEMSFEGGVYDVACEHDSYNNVYEPGMQIMDDMQWDVQMTAPTLDVAPTMFDVQVPPDQTQTATLTVTNNGDGPLTWSSMFQFPETKASYPLYSEVMKDISLKKVDPPVSTGLSDMPLLNDPIGPTINPDDPNNTGYAYVAYDPTGALEVAPCYFPLNDPGTITTMGSAAADFIATADIAMGTWYGVIYGGTLVTIDMNNGDITEIGATADMMGMAWDPTTQTMYGVDFDGGFYTVDLASGATTNAGTTTDGLIGITCTNDGTLYGVDLVNDEFGMIDKTTGDWTVIGPVGFNANYAQDLAIDRTDNTIYWAAYDGGGGGGQLMTIDPTTGSPSLIGSFAGSAEITGFAIPGSAEVWVSADPMGGNLAPGESEEVTLTFDATDLQVGDVKTADLIYTSSPDVGEVTVGITMTCSGVITQTLWPEQGYMFISSRLELLEPNMLDALAPILGDDLDFVRNSSGQMVQKIGPNWVNGIGDWVTTEGYLFKVFADLQFDVEGEIMPGSTPITIPVGYKFISYLLGYEWDAMESFGTIMNDDLDFVRDSWGQMLRKIGPNWINGIGDCVPGHGYLVKTQAEQELIYPTDKSARVINAPRVAPSFFAFEGGNPAEPVYTMYLEGLEIGNEVAAFDGDKMVGATVITSEEALGNGLAIFGELFNGKGYEAGNPITLKVYDGNNVMNLDIELSSAYESYTNTTYPEGDGVYSIAKVTKSALGLEEAAFANIYPNPANSTVYINANNNINRVRVMNYVGQTVLENVATDSNVELNVSGLKSGLYIVEVETEAGTITKKLTIN